MQRSKDRALTAAEQHHQIAPISVYCDSSGFEGGIGTATVLYVGGTEKSSLKYHLGTDAHHTVYEAKIVGLTMGLHLLTSLTRRLDAQTVIGSNSQATIWALNNERLHPAYYLLDHAHSAAKKLHVTQDYIVCKAECQAAKSAGIDWADCTYRVFNLQVHWTPGHLNFAPNE
ncbi:hypothetical protein DXG03_001189 [Asterophora parasitica]|uniref:RNase H type-1 domain-containing protein n=1 Tax=Asterophora parasitica TaxID=117018 RepID=A0A9P7G401_9AGAR|nr:hypothetical protein DXG03_001189 [Asterophora parasitica]